MGLVFQDLLGYNTCDNLRVHHSKYNKTLVMNNKDFPAWHNGKFCQVGDLSIGAQDFGLLRSYGVYDVISVKNNRAMLAEQHIDRFLQGCKYYYLKVEYTNEQLIDIIKQINSQVAEDIHVWVMITRGEPLSNDMRDILKTTPQLMMISSPYTSVSPNRAMRLCIARKVCRIPDSSINQSYKNFARQDFTIAQIESTMRGFDNPVLLDHNGMLTEGPQFSVAVIKDNCVLSPAQNRLPGITMKLVQTLCEENGIKFQYCDINEELLNSAEDAFVTTTAGGVMPIASIDRKQFAETELQQQINRLYQQAWTQDKYSTNLLCS
jgi:branched-chain amino acid aminotransferase